MTGAAGLTDAKASDVAFVHGDAALQDASSSLAGVLLTSRHFPDLKRPQIVVAHPALAMTQIVTEFFVSKLADVGISNLAHLGKNVRLSDGVSVWAFVTLDDGVAVGRGTRLYPGVFVGKGSVIGENCLRTWRKAARQQGEAAFPGNGHLSPADEEVRRLRAEVVRLRAERDLLKKAAAYFASPPR